jgi:hypothetical protein
MPASTVASSPERTGDKIAGATVPKMNRRQDRRRYCTVTFTAGLATPFTVTTTGCGPELNDAGT